MSSAVPPVNRRGVLAGGVALAALGLGLVVSLVDELVILPAARDISVDSARACAAR
nr:hypothetical protein [Mycobacterium sp. E1747]